MNTNVHKSIVNSAAKILPAELKAYLSEKISSGVYQGKSRLELLLKGAVDEDDTEKPGLLSNPDLQLIPSAVMPGKYWPWMEHFWNHDLREGEGLTITAGDLGRLLGLPFGVLTSMIGGLVGEHVVLGQFRSAVDRAMEYWDYHLLPKYHQGKEEEALLCLGRICHLLNDIGTPCHIHNDPHLNILGYDDDDYEDYTSDKAREYGDGFLPWHWDIAYNSNIVYNPDWDLRRYFYELGKISRLYDSDDVDGSGKGHPYHWDHYDDSLINIFPIERDVTGDLTDMACDAIAADLLPVNIMFAAGVICHFFKTINFNISLDVLEVKIKRFYVHDDTDPCGSGEIFLSANLNNNRLYQIGGQHNMHSGQSKYINGAEYSIAITDKKQPIHFYASAYDDDSNYFWKDSESLGNIDYRIDLNQIQPNTPSLVRVDSRGGDGSFSLDIEINLRANEQVVTTFSKIMQCARVMRDPEPLAVTRFKRLKYVPAIINIKSMALHEYAEGGSRLCKRWDHLDEEKKLMVYMFEEELFRETDGKTKLQQIVESKFGQNSKQHKWVKNVKNYKGYCACLRKGYPDKMRTT